MGAERETRGERTVKEIIRKKHKRSRGDPLSEGVGIGRIKKDLTTKTKRVGIKKRKKGLLPDS